MQPNPRIPAARQDQELLKEQSEVCSHKTSLADSCHGCVQESMAQQSVWKMLPDLMKNSRYQRGHGPECTIERDSKKYEVRMVHSTDEKTVQEIQKLMEETFGKEEVEPIEVLRAGIDGRLFDGSKDIARYRLYVARDEAGQIQSVYAGGLVGMADPARIVQGGRGCWDMYRAQRTGSSLDVRSTSF
jgi:hypothetical protein